MKRDGIRVAEEKRTVRTPSDWFNCNRSLPDSSQHRSLRPYFSLAEVR
jgi:hypothetical protein